MSKERPTKSITKTRNHLLVHLGSSLVHFIISLVLTFYWNEADVRNCPSIRTETVGVAIMFGSLTVAYSIISTVKLIMAIRHFCFTPNSQRTIRIIILVTSGASAVLASVGIVVIALLSVGVGAECFDKIPRLGTMIALGVSISLNFVLFTTSLLEWRLQSRSDITEIPGISPCYDATAMTFYKTSVAQPRPSDSPVPDRMYPSDRLSSSFDSLQKI